MSKQKLVWKKKPEAQDYKGALSFLLLIYPDAKAHRLLQLFRKAKTVEHAAKDLLRAGNLPLLSREDPHVEADLMRIRKGKDLPPVLLVRGDMGQGVPLVVADGYHRIDLSFSKSTKDEKDLYIQTRDGYYVGAGN